MRGMLHRLFREPAPLPVGSNPPPHFPKPPAPPPPPPARNSTPTDRELLERIDWKLDYLMRQHGYGWRGGPR